MRQIMSAAVLRTSPGQPPAPPAPSDPEAALAALIDLLVERGLVDVRTLERARRVAGESGQRLDAVLIQLGLVGERGLAESFSALLGIGIAGAERFPEEPL